MSPGIHRKRPALAGTDPRGTDQRVCSFACVPSRRGEGSFLVEAMLIFQDNRLILLLCTPKNEGKSLKTGKTIKKQLEHGEDYALRSRSLDFLLQSSPMMQKLFQRPGLR